jgi:hypothetical protein
MDKHVVLKNYFTKISEVDFVLHVFPEDDLEDKQPKKYFIPMLYSEEYNVWFLNLEDHQLLDYLLIYNFRINKTFAVNHISNGYQIFNQQMFSVHNPNDPTTFYESQVEVNKLYTFVIYANKIHKKSSFFLSESLVQLWVEASNTTIILVQVEWLAPGGSIYSITEHVVEPGMGFQSYIVLQQDYELLFGQWTVNVYTSGQKLSETSFYVTNHEKYKGFPVTPSINRLL